MSLLAPLLLLAAPPVSDIPEIVVVARRLEGVTASVGQDPEGRWYCSLDRSSGVRSLDSGLCKAVTKCVRKGEATDAAIRACVAENKRRLLARFEREYRKRM